MWIIKCSNFEVKLRIISILKIKFYSLSICSLISAKCIKIYLYLTLPSYKFVIKKWKRKKPAKKKLNTSGNQKEKKKKNSHDDKSVSKEHTD